MENPVGGVLCVGWWLSSVVCGPLGAYLGQAKRTELISAALGGLLGPIGLVIAMFIDRREQCPQCGGPLNGRPSLCQHCRTPLAWPPSSPTRLRYRLLPYFAGVAPAGLAVASVCVVLAAVAYQTHLALELVAKEAEAERQAAVAKQELEARRHKEFMAALPPGWTLDHVTTTTTLVEAHTELINKRTKLPLGRRSLSRVDAWGRRVYSIVSNDDGLITVSAGQDGRWGTEDDLSYLDGYVCQRQMTRAESLAKLRTWWTHPDWPK